MLGTLPLLVVAVCPLLHHLARAACPFQDMQLCAAGCTFVVPALVLRLRWTWPTCVSTFVLPLSLVLLDFHALVQARYATCRSGTFLVALRAAGHCPLVQLASSLVRPVVPLSLSCIGG